jgi:hypothetical protein
LILAGIIAACSSATRTPDNLPPETEASVTPEATPPAQSNPTATSTPDEPPFTATTYRDQEGGYEFDYPQGWTLVDVSAEVKQASLLYTVSVFSWPPGDAGIEGIPEGGAKVDVTVFASDAGDLEEALAERRQQITTSDAQSTILAEEEWTLAGGLTGVRLHVESVFGESVELVTKLDGKVVIVGGLGDFDLFDQIARTLRPIETTP